MPSSSIKEKQGPLQELFGQNPPTAQKLPPPPAPPLPPPWEPASPPAEPRSKKPHIPARWALGGRGGGGFPKTSPSSQRRGQRLGLLDFGAVGEKPQLPRSRGGQGRGTPGACLAQMDCHTQGIGPGRNLVALLMWLGRPHAHLGQLEARVGTASWEGSGRGEAGRACGALGRRVFSACAPITPCPQAGPHPMLFGPSICQAWWSPWGTRGSPPSCSRPPAACASPTPAPPGGCSCARRWAPGWAPGWASIQPLWVGGGAQAVEEPAWDPSVSSLLPTSWPGFV